MEKKDSVIAIYPSHAGADAAVRRLHQTGFDMTKLSVVGRDTHIEEHVVGYYNIGERMSLWGKTGAFWGGLWGLLFGSAYFWIPTVGPILIAGPLVTWVVAALESAVVVGGLSAIGAGLYTLGIPQEAIVHYETALKAGKFILVAHGSADEVRHAREILHQTEPEKLDHH